MGKDDPTMNLQIADITVANANSIDWNQIRNSNMNDPTMVRLAHVIQKGWPETTRELFDDIKAYFQYRYALHIVDGIIFLHDRIVVPIGLRQVFSQKIHDAYLEVVKSRLLGWRLMYWSNWNHDIETMCQKCEACRENQSMPVNTPKFKVEANHQRETYGVDVTDFQGKPHIVCVNYYSCCIFERQLKGLHSSDVIKALKCIFCDIGAPD